MSKLLRCILLLATIICSCTVCVARTAPPAVPLPVLQWLPVSTTGETTVMCYYGRGVCFVVGEKEVLAVQVFKGTATPKDTQFSGEDSVLPGVGAFGLRIGDSPKAMPFPDGGRMSISTSNTYSWPNYVVWDFPNGSRMYVVREQNGISSITVSQRFRTPKGISESSSVQDILNAYGWPDFIWGIPSPISGSRPVGIMTAWVYVFVFLLVGCFAGLAYRIYRRRLAQLSPSQE